MKLEFKYMCYFNTGIYIWKCYLCKRSAILFRYQCVNSLAPGKFEWNFIYVIFKQILLIDGCGISCEIALIWMPMDFTDDQSTLAQVMAWCHHYLSQCWPRSLSPYGVTKPPWVKKSTCFNIGSSLLQSVCYVLHAVSLIPDSGGMIGVNLVPVISMICSKFLDYIDLNLSMIVFYST